MTLYKKPDCCLCDEALEAIESIRGEVQFELVQIDVTGDAELEQRYGELLPVIEIDGSKVFEYRVDTQELRDKLVASARLQTANGNVGVTQ